MTQFQLGALALFTVAVLATYHTQLLALVKKLVPSKTDLEVKDSVAVTIIDDLLAVTQLRDKLAAEGCEEGVEACTNLLRVIVEQTKPAKGAV